MAQRPIDPSLRFTVIEMFSSRRRAGLPTPTIREVHLKIGVSMDASYRLIKRLIAGGLIDPIRSPGGAQIWLKRPYSTTASAVRQREYRKKKAAEFCSAAEVAVATVNSTGRDISDS